jgi:hypothetical protein
MLIRVRRPTEVVMRKLLVPLLPVLLLAGFSPGARCEDEVRAILTRAISAQGGEEKLAREVAMTSKVKGTMQVGGDGLPFTVDLFNQPGGQTKFTLRVELGGARTVLTEALTGDKGWRSRDDQVEDLGAQDVAEMQRSVYLDRVLNLVPLLKEKSFTLTALGESKVNGQPVLGVKVTSKGQAEVKLFFARDSGLLAKYERMEPDPETKKEVLQETYPSDYREPDLGAVAEQTLKAAKLSVEGPALLEFLRKEMPSAVDADRIKELIRRLGDDSFEVREKASADLVALGAAARPALEQAKTDKDTEIARRAQECLQKIGGAAFGDTVAAAVRLVGLRKPEGAAEVLLACVGHTPDEELAREVQSALAAVAVRDGKPDKVLEQALEDKDPRRRAAAAAALGRDGGAWAKQPGHRLFLDGVKLPMKSVTYSDGKKLMEVEVLDVQFFNRLDDSVFARPRGGKAEPKP